MRCINKINKYSILLIIFVIVCNSTACASKNIIEYAQFKKPYYYGNAVPIYAVSEDGRRFLDCRLKHINKPLSTNDYPQDLTKMSRELK